MLEMLNPTSGDLLRFAATALKVRSQLNRAMKDDPMAAQRLAVEIFCTPPAAARRVPDLTRLRDDTKRFFGWNATRWRALEEPIRALIDTSATYSVVHNGLNVQCYSWRPTDKAGKPRKAIGRMLLCHGWEGYALNFALLISKALTAGYEVHTFDHLAHGASEGTYSGLPTALETLLTVEQHVQRHYGAIDVLVGHSLGGAAAAWASAHSQITPKSLVLLAPFYDTRKLSRQWAQAHLLSEPIREALERGLEKASGRKFDDFMPSSLATHLSPKRALPVLILHDPADKVTAFKHSASLAKLASNVTLLEAKSLGHIAILADENCVEQILEFAGSST
jgi:alpha-beta hydrolase superfamily lysophospholipase